MEARRVVLLRQRLLRGSSPGGVRLAQPVNIGNPDEFTLLELAEIIKTLTGSSSEIVFEALPVDDPRQRKPDIASPASSSSGRRRCRCGGPRAHNRAVGAELLIAVAPTEHHPQASELRPAVGRPLHLRL